MAPNTMNLSFILEPLYVINSFAPNPPKKQHHVKHAINFEANGRNP